MPLFLKAENKIPGSIKISPYDYTKLNTICKLREISIKDALELINKLKIEVKYQTTKKEKILYISADDDVRISGEILISRFKSENQHQ